MEIVMYWCIGVCRHVVECMNVVMYWCLCVWMKVVVYVCMKLMCEGMFLYACVLEPL